MKRRTFGNEIDNDIVTRSSNDESVEIINNDTIRNEIDGPDTTGSEFYNPSDILSYSTLNRAIEGIFEDNENSYEILQNVVKALWGQKETGVIPDIFEEFNSSNLVCGAMPSGAYYIRVPTGAFIAKIPDKYYNNYKYRYEESAQYDRDFFIDSDHNSITIFNRPNINLFERQLADHFNINLNDEDNRIKVDYTIENTTVDAPDTLSEEENILQYNKDRYNKTRTIHYSVSTTTTKYEYKTVQSGGTAIETTPETKTYNNIGDDIFTVVQSMNVNLGNYLMKKDDLFSLEEIIPIEGVSSYIKNKLLKDSDKCVIFYNISSDPFKYTSEADGSRTYHAWYSYTKKFGIALKDEFYGTVKEGSGKVNCKKYFEKATVPLFELSLKPGNVPEIFDKSILMEKIDRTKFEVRNVEVVNLINNLVLERRGTSYNISNSHFEEGETALGNINVGDNTLGYRQLDGVDKDPSLYSQYYRDKIGSYNIAIGDQAMRNTDNPTNNIAIGNRALINIENGNNNIEIGYGNGSKFGNYNINIGYNLLDTTSGETTVKEVTTSNYNNNITIGYKNLEETEVTNDNVVIGSKNKFFILKSNNYILGENNGVEKRGESNANVENRNYIIGYNNLQDYNDSELDKTFVNYLKDDNYIFGRNNTIVETNDSYAVGIKNTIFGNKNIIIGQSNFSEGEEAFIFGKENINQINKEAIDADIVNSNSGDSSDDFDSSDDNNEEKTLDNTNNIVVGTSNAALASYINIFGTNNTASYSNNDIFGVGNSACISNVLVGKRNKFYFKSPSTNKIFNVKNNVVFGNDNNVVDNDNGDGSNKTINNNIVVGCNNIAKNSNSIVIGYNNTALANSIIIGQYKDIEGNITVMTYPHQDTVAPMLLKAYGKDYYDENKYKVLIDAYNEKSGDSDIKVSSNRVYYTNDIEVEHELYSNYNIAVSINGNNQSKKYAEQQENIENVILSVPVAGTIQPETELYNIKSFIGFRNDKYIISIRPANGYDNTDYAALTIDKTENPGGFVNVDKDGTNINLLDSSEQAQLKKGNLTINGITTVKNRLLVDIGDDYYFHVFCDEDGNSTDYIKTNKDIYAESFIATSARDKKKNIVDTTHTNAVEEINKIKIVDFNFKTDTNNENPKVGFIADDTDEIFSTKEHNSMDIYNCVGMLLKAVQELSAENKKLQEEINTLK